MAPLGKPRHQKLGKEEFLLGGGGRKRKKKKREGAP